MTAGSQGRGSHPARPLGSGGMPGSGHRRRPDPLQTGPAGPGEAPRTPGEAPHGPAGSAQPRPRAVALQDRERERPPLREGSAESPPPAARSPGNGRSPRLGAFPAPPLAPGFPCGGGRTAPSIPAAGRGRLAEPPARRPRGTERSGDAAPGEAPGGGSAEPHRGRAPGTGAQQPPRPPRRGAAGTGAPTRNGPALSTGPGRSGGARRARSRRGTAARSFRAAAPRSPGGAATLGRAAAAQPDPGSLPAGPTAPRTGALPPRAPLHRAGFTGTGVQAGLAAALPAAGPGTAGSGDPRGCWRPSRAPGMNVPLSPARSAGSPQLPAARLPDLPGRAQPLSAAPGRPAGAGSPRLRAAGQGTAASPVCSGPGTAGTPRPRRPVGAVRPSPRLPLPGGTERHREPPYLAAPGEPRRRRPAGAAPGARRAPGPPRPPVPPCRRCRRCGAERGGAEWRERGGAGAGGEEETKSRQSRTRIPGTPAGAPPRRAGRSPAKRRAAGRGGAGRGAPGPAGGRARSCGRPPGTSALPAPARLPLTEIECGRRRFTGRSGSLGPPR